MTETKPMDYPLTRCPGTGDGTAVELAPGVLWLRMPLPGSLRWINVWALAEQDGWAIVDTGLRSPATLAAWRAALAGALGARRVTRVIATHMHPDHCGMAGWMSEQFAARLWMSRLEYLTCRLMAADTGRQAPPEGIEFYRAAGWDQAAIDSYRARFGMFGEAVYPLPAGYRRLQDGEQLAIGANSWQVVVGSGHSPEHACLYCASLRLFISGDQVLPRISSNVSVYPTEPDADPLHNWLTSLAGIRTRVVDDVLVLPAHNDPFTGLHARIGQLIAGHEVGLVRLQSRLVARSRAVDVFDCLFARPIGDGNLGMATGEALAHLNYLLKHGNVVRETDSQGVWWWRNGS